jgi:hypothetical protein
MDLVMEWRLRSSRVVALVAMGIAVWAGCSSSSSNGGNGGEPDAASSSDGFAEGSTPVATPEASADTAPPRDAGVEQDSGTARETGGPLGDSAVASSDGSGPPPPLVDAGDCFALVASRIGLSVPAIPWTTGAAADATPDGGAFSPGTYVLTADIFSEPACETGAQAGQYYGTAAAIEIVANGSGMGVFVESTTESTPVLTPGATLLGAAGAAYYAVQGGNIATTSHASCLASIISCGGNAELSCDAEPPPGPWMPEGGPSGLIVDAGTYEYLVAATQPPMPSDAGDAGDAGAPSLSYTATANEIDFYSTVISGGPSCHEVRVFTKQ